MIIVENKIRDWKTQIQAQAATIAHDATTRFLANISQSDFPTEAELAQAAAQVREQASAALTGDEMLSALPNAPASPNAQEAFRLAWLGLVPKLQIPPPDLRIELATWRLAMAAALGSLLGMLLLGGLMHVLLNLRAVGMLFGGIIGAASVVYGVSALASSAKLRSGLTALLGVSSVAQLLLTFSSIGLGGLWGRLAGAGLLKRLIAFVGMLGLLLFVRRDNRFDPAAFKPMVQALIGHWVEYNLLLLISLNLEPSEISQRQVFDPALARSITDLHHATADDLPLAAESVLQEAQRCGLEGIEGSAQFVALNQKRKQALQWSETLSQQYKPFGLIEVGDSVVVESEPVIQNGVVIDFGRVRKVRKP